MNAFIRRTTDVQVKDKKELWTERNGDT